MTALNIFNTLLNAWETSTPSNNRFADKLIAIDWEDTFFADGEHYFVNDCITFTTPVLDPFESFDWVPTATTADGSFLSF